MLKTKTKEKKKTTTKSQAPYTATPDCFAIQISTSHIYSFPQLVFQFAGVVMRVLQDYAIPGSSTNKH